jgi:hypothetical protein
MISSVMNLIFEIPEPAATNKWGNQGLFVEMHVPVP